MESLNNVLYRLRDAAAYWRKALAAIHERENWGRLPLPVIGWVYMRLGELLYEWNELAEAWDHLSRGLERAELSGDVRAMIAGYLIAGRLKLTEGDTEAAAEYLEHFAVGFCSVVGYHAGLGLHVGGVNEGIHDLFHALKLGPSAETFADG